MDELIKEIAVKHGVAIGKDDPILIMHTINNYLMDNNAKRQDALLNQFKGEMEILALRWIKDAKDLAERILNNTLKASKEEMAHVLAQSAKTTSMTIQTDIEQSLEEVRNALGHTKRIALFNCIAACLTAVSAASLIIISGHLL
ncbi:hypothetical protein [Legionella fairfieldensis]|uniref:hypothetical protein n=1 Tax=Legionella fairfieldensis TaxID=45064 RepID=UPI00048E89EF|nr:hypothetical protein [Legionella fairfieldensis]